MSEGDSECKEARISQKTYPFFEGKSKEIEGFKKGSAYLHEGEDFAAPTTCLSPAEHPQGRAFRLHPHPSGDRSLLNTYF